MLSLIGYGLLGIVVAVGVVALLVLVLPADHLAVAARDVVPSGLPVRPEINADDVTRVRLPVTFRGYRMVDTDAVLDRLAIELLHREEEIDELRRAAGLGPRSTADTAHGYGAAYLDSAYPENPAYPDSAYPENPAYPDGTAYPVDPAGEGADEVLAPALPDTHAGYASVGSLAETHAAGDEGAPPVRPIEPHPAADERLREEEMS